MAGGSAAERVDEFLAALPAAPARVLLLDYDGTLAPFRVERDQATPYAGVREAVRGLTRSRRTRVVVISGRSLDGLRPLLGVEPPPELWGTHGWERLAPGHPPLLRPLPDGSAAALARAARVLDGPELHDRIEVKPASVALHVRGLPEPDAERVIAQARAAWEPLARAASLELHPFDGGLELRVSGWHKGDAVRAVLATEPEGTAAAYLGDDATDEDAFAALEELSAGGRIRGLSVLVRAEPRPSRAPVRLEPPGELLAFLGRWRSVAG
jgi:trehalose-phosphatase